MLQRLAGPTSFPTAISFLGVRSVDFRHHGCPISFTRIVILAKKLLLLRAISVKQDALGRQKALVDVRDIVPLPGFSLSFFLQQMVGKSGMVLCHERKKHVASRDLL